MVNIKNTVKGNILTVEIDISQTFGASKSGKTITVASTKGNQKIETPKGDVVLGVNCYKYPE